jgi:hypothetical protein
VLGTALAGTQYPISSRWKLYPVSWLASYYITSLTWAYYASCFPHIINISVQTVLKELKENPCEPVLLSCSNPDPRWRAELLEYANTLAVDLVGSARSLVGTCWKSGQRWNDLRATIIEGNVNKSYGKDKDGRDIQLLEQELLRDYEICWSSTHNMSSCVINLYPVIIK